MRSIPPMPCMGTRHSRCFPAAPNLCVMAELPEINPGLLRRAYEAFRPSNSMQGSYSWLAPALSWGSACFLLLGVVCCACRRRSQSHGSTCEGPVQA